jgi:amino acid adenylation domain-containing protein
MRPGSMMAGDAIVCPMSFSQRQLWYLQRLVPHSSAYNIPFALEIEGELRVDPLVDSINELIAKHEILRTTYGLVDAAPSQLIHDEASLAVQTEDGSGWSEETYEEAIRAEAARPFDLKTELPIRLRVIRRGEARWAVLWTVHHIAMDHITVVQLGEELAQSYERRCSGGPAPIPDQDALQYVDFAMWQIETLSDAGALDERLDAWKERLRGTPTVLELPLDHPRPRTQSFAGAEIRVSIEEVVRRRVIDSAQAMGVSLFVLMLAAFKVCVGAYAGRRDVVTGCPFANRPTPELETVAGLFMNLLPIRATWTADSTVRSLVDEVRGAVLGGQRYQDTPFEKIVEALELRSDPAVNPLVQTWFTVQTAPMQLSLPGLEVRTRHPHNGGAKLDLSAWWWDEGKTLEGAIEYDTALFDEGTVTRLMETYAWILRQMAEQPDARLDTLSLCPPGQQASLASAQGARRPDVLHTLVEGIARSFSAHGARWAVRSQGDRLRYGDLETRVRRLAAGLVVTGVGPGDLVGICTNRSEEMVTAVLGVLFAGAAYVPLDPAYPLERLRYIVGDSGLRTILSDPVNADTASQCGADVLIVGDVESSSEDPTSHPTIDPEAIAYVIYTSGSTGNPKGVQVPHRAVASFLYAMAEEPGLGQDDVLAAVTTLSFDISVLELLLPLWTGAECAIVDSADARDGNRLAERLSEWGATTMQATPATWRLLLHANVEWPPVKALCGGEALPADVAAGLTGRVAELWNMYGPTETTVWSTCAQVIAGDDPDVTIGRPILNTSVRIVDDTGRDLPIGAPGEIWIGGDGVTLGYRNRPELTDDRFVEADATTWYRTGDVGRYRGDLQLLHLGRSDRQLKLRGHRIEPGEIEAALSEMPEVRSAIVSARPFGPNDTRLVAHVVGASDEPPTATVLRRGLRSVLPAHMVPSVFVPLDQFPKLPNGKIDVAALPMPATMRSAPRSKDALRPGLEADTATLWSELLKYEGIGPDDNFFDLGGYSLLAMEAVAAMQQRFGHVVEPRAMFFQTLRQLVEETGR